MAPEMVSALLGSGPPETNKAKPLAQHGEVAARSPVESAWGGWGWVALALSFRSGRCCHLCSRYLNFYKQTMDLLTRDRIVSSQEVTLPVVSAAISHLWQTLSEEKKAGLLQAVARKHGGLAGLGGAPREPACAEDSMKDSGVDSQGASYSLESTPEEVSGPWGRGGGVSSRSLSKSEELFRCWLTWSVSDFPDIIFTTTTERHFLFFRLFPGLPLGVIGETP